MARKRNKKFKEKMRKIMLKCALKGKSHPNYKNGKWLTKYCINCNKKLKNKQAKRCKSCAQSAKIRTKNWNTNIGLSSKKRWKNPNYRKKVITLFIKHHKYGKTNPKTIQILRKYHNTIHAKAYWYILEKYGKKAIDNYLKWFLTKLKKEKKDKK